MPPPPPPPHSSRLLLADAARRDQVVKQALADYQNGLDTLKKESATPGQPGTSSGTQRELALEEAVAIALEKNLDIAVSRLEPQSVDLQIAGVRNLYKPLFTSTLGMRDQYQLPTSSLNGGTKVNNGTTTYNFGLTKETARYGGTLTVNWTNSRLDTSNTFSNFNPSYQTNLVAAYVAAVAARLPHRQHAAAAVDQPDQPRHLGRERAGHGHADAGERAERVLGPGLRAKRRGRGA